MKRQAELRPIALFLNLVFTGMLSEILVAQKLTIRSPEFRDHRHDFILRACRKSKEEYSKLLAQGKAKLFDPNPSKEEIQAAKEAIEGIYPTNNLERVLRPRPLVSPDMMKLEDMRVIFNMAEDLKKKFAVYWLEVFGTPMDQPLPETLQNELVYTDM